MPNWKKIDESWKNFASLKKVELEHEERHLYAAKTDQYKLSFRKEYFVVSFIGKMNKANTEINTNKTVIEAVFSKPFIDEIRQVQKTFNFFRRKPNTPLGILTAKFMDEYGCKKVEVQDSKVRIEFPFIFEELIQFKFCETYLNELLESNKG